MASGDYGSGLGTLSAAMSGARTTGGARGKTFSIVMHPSSKKIALGFEKWADNIDRDLDALFDDIVRMTRKHFHNHFRTQGRLTGPRWPVVNAAGTPGGAAYALWKESNFPGRPTLVASGALRGALVKGGRGSIGGKRGKRTATSIEIGLSAGSEIGIYGAAHQFALGPAYRIQKKPRPPIRYDATVKGKKHLQSVGRGGAVPLGSAFAQLFQAYIVKARKRTVVESISNDRFDFRKMRRGVMRLKTR